MAVTAVVNTEKFSELRAEVRTALRQRDEDRLNDLLDGFHTRVVEAVAARDRAQLAKLGGQTGRLRALVQTAAPDGTLAGAASLLKSIARTIEISWTTEAMASSRQAPPTPKQFTVPGQVLSLLQQEGRCRPRDVAAHLGISDPQVSRALKSLQAAGLATHLIQSRGADEDGRAVFWMATASERARSRAEDTSAAKAVGA